MLRKTVVLLIVINVLCWVWARNWLAPIGLPATPAGEPERLTQQIHPENLRVRPLPPNDAAPVPAASAALDPASDTATDRRRGRRR